MAPHQKRMHKHFSEIAPAYRALRTTDLEPIRIEWLDENNLFVLRS
jgi:hypothetical protein